MSDQSIIEDKKKEKNNILSNFLSKILDFLRIKEEKREEIETNIKEFIYKILDFLKFVVLIIIVILIYFSSSGLALFMCKLAQTNILPTEERCYPYTDTKPTIQPIKTNIFTTYDNPPMSMKMEFPHNDYNLTSRLLESLRDYKKTPTSIFLVNYFISIIEGVMQYNYLIINTIMNKINETLPESVIIFLAPILLLFLSAIMIIVSSSYFVYLWFTQMGWFFKTNTAYGDDKEAKWKKVSMIIPEPIAWLLGYVGSPFKWFTGIILSITFIVLLFMYMRMLAFIPIVTVIWCLLSCILFQSEINGTSANILTIILNVFKYYKLPVIGITSFFVILLLFAKLGIISGVFSILIMVLLIYFKIIEIDIFKPISEQNLSPLTSYSQAKKTCLKKTHGFLYNLLMGQKGGDITNQIKKIGQNL